MLKGLSNFIAVLQDITCIIDKTALERGARRRAKEATEAKEVTSGVTKRQMTNLNATQMQNECKQSLIGQADISIRH